MTSRKEKIKTAERFDPFTERTARDIRNSLSEAFVAALAAKDPEPYLNIAQKWQEQNVSSLYADYIDDRLQRYQNVFDAVQAGGIDDPLQQAIVVWNQGLYIEFHDHLEPLTLLESLKNCKPTAPRLEIAPFRG
ncbi:MAG: hypothetical protein P8185_16345 [Deltaproteobacteria bacterium]